MLCHISTGQGVGQRAGARYIPIALLAPRAYGGPIAPRQPSITIDRLQASGVCSEHLTWCGQVGLRIGKDLSMDPNTLLTWLVGLIVLVLLLAGL